MSGDRIHFIDGFRGIAAVAVLVQHMADRFIQFHGAELPLTRLLFVETIDLGRFGVALFFLISGYVVPFSFRSPHALGRFAVTRFFRLYPAYWASIAGAFVAIWFANGYVLSGQQVAWNLTMIESAVGVPTILGPYWTLIIELAFYALCAALFAVGLLGRAATAVVLCLVFLAIAGALTGWGLATGTYRSANMAINLSVMFLGMVARRADQRDDAASRRAALGLAAVLFVGIPLLIAVSPLREDMPFTRMSFATAYMAAFAMFFLARGLPVVRHPAALFLGASSYGIYLFHEIVLILSERAVQHALEPAGVLAFLVVSFAGSIVVGYAVHRTIELPGIAIGRKATARLFGDTADRARAQATLART